VLKSIRVFDTSSAAHYVNKEDTLSLNPAGLHLLTNLADAVSADKSDGRCGSFH